MLEDIELAYAITVHKSQGSEFNAVILPLLDGANMLYTRNLLYTAVTRAKKILIILGSPQKVLSMVKNNITDKRYSGLKFQIWTMNK
jgi:exodeoxyribonuclease V alpha subunit